MITRLRREPTIPLAFTLSLIFAERTEMATSSENSSLPGGLTAAQLAQFRKDGYLVLPGWFDPAPLLTQGELLTILPHKDI